MALQQPAETDGQDMPGDVRSSRGGAPPGPPPRAEAPSGAFAADTLSSLLTTQEQSSGTADLVGKLIEAGDADGDGMLSLEEIRSALGSDDADALSAALGRADGDGDGKLSASELDAALEANRPARRGPPPAPPSGSDLAAQLLSDTDTDGDEALSAEEIRSALSETGGEESLASLDEAVGALDTDGDGKLSAAELSAALESFRTAHQRGEGAQPQAIA